MGLADFATLKSDERGKYPGPGQYPLKSCFDKDTGRGPALSARYDRRAGDANPTVGPGRYDVPSLVGSGPRITIAAPHPPASHRGGETDLGPKYSPRQHDMSVNPITPRFSFGRRHEAVGKAAAAAAPGPGAYQLATTLSQQGASLAFRTRPTDGVSHDAADVPGPGMYALDRFGDKVPPTKTIERHRNNPLDGKDDFEVPGPGSYDVVVGTVGDRARPRVGERAREIGTLGGKCHAPDPTPCGAPGPAAYSIPDSFSPQSARKKGVSILSRFTEYNDMDEIYPKPGPGDYTIPSTLDVKGRGTTMGAKLQEPKPKTIVPGPGAYNPAQYSLAESTTKGTSGIRFNAEKTFADGVKSTSSRVTHVTAPSELNPLPVLPTPPGPKMCKPTKVHVQHRKPLPGPGAYDLATYDKSWSSTGTTFYLGAPK